MSTILANIKYLLAPSLILVTFFGVLAGGLLSWIGVALLGVGVVVDTILRKQASSAMHKDDGTTKASPTFQNMVMYFMLPVFVLLQLALAWRVNGFMTGVPVEVTSTWFNLIPVYSGITSLDLIGAVLSTGIFAGIGIIYGHELSHCKGFAFIISRMTMGLSGSAHFCYAHVYNHHLELASEDDPATAPRGRTIYGHYPLSYLGQSKFLFNMEKERLSRMGVSFISWQNRWIRGY